MASLQQIISWFRDGMFPTGNQFRQTWMSFWHKSEKIPQEQIFGLQQTIEASSRGLIYQNPVATKTALSTTYPNPLIGWAAMVQDEGVIYSWNGEKWANTGLKAFPDNVALISDLTEIEETLAQIKDIVYVREENFILPTDFINEGYLNPDGSFVDDVEYKCTETIEIGEDVLKFHITSLVGSLSVSPVVFFDANREFISGITAPSTQDFSIEVDKPANAVFAVFSIMNDLLALSILKIDNSVSIKSLVQKLI